ncbi:MAG TPA: acyl-CoA dehydrogenase family protein [Chloroflexota bacterium]|nr:acyl-CoA dehydrogenase family protein [Chloroflexota bacterium]
MDFELPWEVKTLQQTVRQFVERELIPIEIRVNQHEELSDDVLRPLQDKVKALGLWLLDVPKGHGGAGLGLLERCVIQEEISKTKALPFRHNELFGPVVGPILYHCNAEHRERFLYPVIRGELRVCFAQTEPDSGADPASMQTRAVRDGGFYILNGSKRFITDAGRADYAQVICVTDPEKRARGGISVLTVDMKSPGVTLVRKWPTMMGDEPWEITFEDVRVPVENRIGEEGKGFALGQAWLTDGRVKGHGARCVGIAQRALEMAMDYACQRVTFGQPLSERQAIQFMIADSAIELRAARLMVYETAWRSDQGQDVRNDSYMTKIYCTEMASRVVDRAIQIHGGVGLTKELPLEYWYRQLRSIRITEGATEVLRWRLARNLMRTRG